MDEYEIEYDKKFKKKHCDFLGRVADFSNGFIYKSGNAVAIYRACWSPEDAEKKVHFLVAVDSDWDKDTSPDRISVLIDLFDKDDEIIFRVVDPKEGWSDWPSHLGRLVSREGFFSSGWSKEVYSIIEFVIRRHPYIREYLEMEPL